MKSKLVSVPVGRVCIKHRHMQRGRSDDRNFILFPDFKLGTFSAYLYPKERRFSSLKSPILTDPPHPSPAWSHVPHTQISQTHLVHM